MMRAHSMLRTAVRRTALNLRPPARVLGVGSERRAGSWVLGLRAQPGAGTWVWRLICLVLTASLHLGTFDTADRRACEAAGSGLGVPHIYTLTIRNYTYIHVQLHWCWRRGWWWALRSHLKAAVLRDGPLGLCLWILAESEESRESSASRCARNRENPAPEATFLRHLFSRQTAKGKAPL